MAAVVALGVGLIVSTHGSSSGSSSPRAPAAPLLAGLSSSATGQPVDGIRCDTGEQLLFHVHAHLAVFVDGRQRLIPAGVGIAPPRDVARSPDGPFVDGGSCLYWLHSHTQDGVIHIESPVRQTFTLGEYFDVWGQPLSSTEVGPARGPVSGFVDGRLFTGDPRSIPLGAHTVVQLDVGAVVAPRPYSFPPGL